MHCVTTLSLKPGPASVVRRALRALASTLSGAYTAWMRHRQVRATAHVLGLLDDHLLHDLALDRSELLSAAAELHGRARPERRHAELATQLPR
jgi:uncharacterized protein YjiS (DUF1127 family)